ncbi:hypothetical protein F4604DRAFT_1879751 [Suillus subluteus]|nr:hypothetical protein F4604DRAFT_1879751 [Suillus subluteus]
MSESLDSKHDFEDATSAHLVVDDLTRDYVRPPINYSSPAAFTSSSWARWKSIWTRRFTLSLLAGQVTNVTTTELVSRNWTLSTTQTWFLYCSLFLVYTPYTMYKWQLLGRKGKHISPLISITHQSSSLIEQAYNYTDLLSCMLLDAWAIPVCLFFCWVYMRTKYHWTQVLGILVCVGGLGMLVSSDMLTDKNYPALSKGKGDAFMIVGATLYGFTNATEEFFVRRSPLYEVVGQLGMWGTLINGIQAASLEHAAMTTASWNGATIGFLAAYTAAMFTLYTVAPLLYRMASSPFYNISLLTSDFYGLLFGLFLFVSVTYLWGSMGTKFLQHYSPYWLYFPAFCVVVLGLIIYFWHATPEEQGKLEPKAPAYIRRMHPDDQA